MKIFKTSQVIEADNYTIKHEPIASIDLMERAAINCFKKIIKKSNSDNYIIFAGLGNNGGDGLVIARLLAEKKKTVKVYILNLNNKFSDDFIINLERLKKQNIVKVSEIKSASDFPKLENNELIIDSLFGSGLTRPLEDLSAKLVQHINENNNIVYAIDIPSGLFGEDNSKNISDNIIKANKTFTFEFPKLSFLFAENYKYTGKFYIINIGVHKDFIDKTDTDFYFTKKADVIPLIKKRDKFSHKGDYGHALLITGSYGMMGAGVLSAKACLRTGVGLLSTYIPKSGYEIMQTSVPEAMCRVYYNEDNSIEDFGNYSAIGIGSGLGKTEKSKQILQSLLENHKQPIVIDADALNLISENKNLLKLIPENSIITPHPKEFERLTQNYKTSAERIYAQIEFSTKHKIYVVLKGAYTSVSTPKGKCHFNTTGNAGMATAGSGDVLTGIILSLLAQGYSSENAAKFGVYLHGLAGDIARKKYGIESVISSDIIKSIGKAYIKLS